MKNYYIYFFLKNLIFYIPILVIYLNFILKDSTLVGIVLSVKTFSVFFLEIPMGYVADKVGRKISLYLSSIANIFSLIFFIVSPTFVTLILAEFLFSLSETLMSGADIALIYDNLKYENREKEFDEFQRKSFFISSIALAIAFIIGSYIYSKNKKSVFLLSIIISIGLLYILRKIKEYPYRKEVEKKGKLEILKEDFENLKKESRILKKIVFYSAIIVSIFMGIYFYIFPIELNKFTSDSLIYGMFYCIGVLFIGMGGKFQKYIKNNLTFIYLGPIILIPLIFWGFFFKNINFMITLILIIRIFWGIYSNAVNIEINRRIKNSEIRATIFSIKNAILNIILGLFFISMGLMNRYNFTSFNILGIYGILLIGLIFLGVILMKKKEE